MTSKKTTATKKKRTDIKVFLKKPNQSGRASFAIVVQPPNSKAYTQKSEVITSINKSYKNSSLTLAEANEAAMRELKRVKDTLIVKTGKVVMSTANRRILNKYWEEVYSHRTITDPKSARYRLERAIATLEDVSLHADKNTLQKKINTACKGKSSKQRTVVGALNQLLKWLGRTDVVLHRDFKEFNEPKYLTISEFKKVLAHVDSDYKSLMGTLFATGARLGAAFAIYDYKDKIFIQKQMRDDGSYGPTKNRKRRTVVVVPELKSYVKEWCKIEESQRLEIRLKRYGEIFTEACMKTFPKKPNKHLTARDLRHCYAIHLLNKGVSLSLVAQSLGNSIQVCQEYYAGFSLNSDSVDLVSKLLKS